MNRQQRSRYQGWWWGIGVVSGGGVGFVGLVGWDATLVSRGLALVAVGLVVWSYRPTHRVGLD
ncbi:hypothetical protein SE18_19435 [Herpetosiphon geysericola]|uniref:Uncharacterized protein n=1 Tax=Herpetosiphon geysericola TaxID=70996 RepID=A0A0N8GQ88_9CHLR|nr:hypothetical protein SE18_19435 [Herpetosiphon geysericola]